MSTAHSGRRAATVRLLGGLVTASLGIFALALAPATAAAGAVLVPTAPVLLSSAQPTSYEAEDGTISNGTLTGVLTAANASGGEFVRLDVGVGEHNTISGVDGGDGGEAQVTIRYAYGAGDTNTKALYVNGVDVGNVVFPSTSPSNDWTVWGEKTITVTLDAGTGNTIQLINEASTYYTLRLDVYSVDTEPPAPYEAEDGQISSGPQTAVVAAANASGGEFVRLDVGAGEFNTISGVDGGAGGDAVVTIRYANGAGNSNTKALFVNGVKISYVVFPSTSSTNDWTVWGEKTITVPLDAGANNTIQLINEIATAYPLRLDVYRVDPRPEMHYQAEAGQISSGAQTGVLSAANASGGQFVRLGVGAGEYNTISDVDGGAGGDAVVTIRYAYGAGDTNTKALYVNGIDVGNVVFPSTSPSNDWTVWGEKTITVALEAGADNTIQLVNEVSTYYTLRLDVYTVRSSDIPPPQTFYVDSAAGNDANSGTDTSTPWKTFAHVNAQTFTPGDRILLKAGSVWNGETLAPKGSGTSAHPITLGSYGSGAKPQLNGNGEVTQLVYLRNQSWWTVEDLEITNLADVEFVDTLMGVRVEAINSPTGLVSGITVQDLDIHSINGVKGLGTVQFPSLIYFSAGGTVTPSAFDRILVRDTSTMNSIPNGLNFYSTNLSRGGPYSTNVHVDNVSGNTAQIYWMLDGAVIENNRLVDVGSFRPQYNSDVFAAIFPTYSKNLTFQYNEIINTAASGDSQGFDFDLHLGGRNVFQYNYTYGNSGALLVMQQSDPNAELIYRYNVSHNDASGDFRLGDGNVHVYNNVVYNPDEVITINTWGDATTANRFENNIFVGAGMSVKAAPGLAEPIFDSNLYYGFPGPLDANKIVGDPQFVDVVENAGLAGVDGFELGPDSPARNTGAVIANAGVQDILGNPLFAGSPDRGAIEQPGGADGELPVVDAQRLEAETGVLSGDAGIRINTDASGWNAVNGLGQVGASVAFADVVVPAAGDYRVELRYSGGQDAADKALYVNGVKAEDVDFTPTDDRFDYATVRPVVELVAGPNDIEIRSETADPAGATEVYLDLVTVVSDAVPVVPDPGPPTPPTQASVTPVDVQFTEVERIEISEGGASTIQNPATSGGRFVSNLHYVGRYVSWHHVNGGAGGTYTLNIGFRTGNDGAKLGIYVDGVRQGEVSFANTGWVDFSTTSVEIELPPGAEHTLTLKNDELPGNVGVGLDYFQLVRDGVDPPEIPEPVPGPNLAADPGFEGTTGWTLGSLFTRSTTDPHGGASALQAVGVSGSDSGATQSIALEPYHDYRVTFWAKSTGDRSIVRMLSGGLVVAERAVPTNNAWTEYTIRFNAGTRTAITLYLGINGAGTYRFDDISVQRMSDLPRYPNLVSNGEFDTKSTTNWSFGGVFALSAEDRLTGFASVKVDGTGGDSTLTQTVRTATQTEYRVSFWVRSPDGTVAYVVRGANGTPLTGPQTVSADDGWVQVIDTFDSGTQTAVTVEFVDVASGESFIDGVEVVRIP